MSDFAGMEDLLQDFLQEANDLLSDVDNKLVDLEKAPDDRGLLNDIFRGFHTIKGGAGFLNATELVTLCHLTENLFDRLHNGEMQLSPELMDIIMAATKGVRDMFGELSGGVDHEDRAHVVAGHRDGGGADGGIGYIRLAHRFCNAVGIEDQDHRAVRHRRLRGVVPRLAPCAHVLLRRPGRDGWGGLCLKRPSRPAAGRSGSRRAAAAWRSGKHVGRR